MVGLLWCCLLSVPAAEIQVPGTGIFLRPPAGWSAVAPTPAVAFRWRSPDGGAGIAVSSTPVLEGQGPAQAIQPVLKDLEQLLGSYALIEHRFDVTLGARSWYGLHWRHRFADQDWEQELWLTVVDRRQVVVALGSTSAAFKAAQGELRRMLGPSGASGATLVPAGR